MSDIIFGTAPVAVRQKLKITKDFTGVAPGLTGPPAEVFTPHFSNSLYVYSNDDTPPITEADQGGLFVFGEQPVEIAAIHLDVADSGTAGDINVTISDSDGSCVRTVAALTGISNEYWCPAAGQRVFVLPNQILKVTKGAAAGTKAGGFKHATIYAVKAYAAGLV